jgi:hypothetical protein
MLGRKKPNARRWIGIEKELKVNAFAFDFTQRHKT